ncbi:MAG: hypothetical protein B7Y80_16210 [Hyphomicrobium sp. 32-62-53]|nr:MAG: hypothetical protein B7Y80_16210 [Hyphomicrobium sp. 32-62-53]
MSRATVDLKSDVYRILAWSVVLPALVVWPFLSAMPAITLFGGGLTVPELSINLLLLLTGFWSIFGAYLAAIYARGNTARAEHQPTNNRSLLLGAYALAWTTLYLIVVLASR